MARAPRASSGISSLLAGTAAILVLLICLGVHSSFHSFSIARNQMRDEIIQLQQDLNAHQKALELQTRQCDANAAEHLASTAKAQSSINYYKDNIHKLALEQCTDVQAEKCSENKVERITELKMDLELVTKERDDLSDRIQSFAMCCHATTAKADALSKGLGEEKAREHARDAIAGSYRAYQRPQDVMKHTQRIIWNKNSASRQRYQKNVTTPRTTGLGGQSNSQRYQEELVIERGEGNQRMQHDDRKHAPRGQPAGSRGATANASAANHAIDMTQLLRKQKIPSRKQSLDAFERDFGGKGHDEPKESEAVLEDEPDWFDTSEVRKR
ncbi:hypothetical protein CYMTET_38792 [Cymbomonas tetramitiformis]|uniref:Uncharacterized protein n=1 Tax=Cymbomonas tetramitiformis TaxID=36881 RepID=A0AAE0CD17_9CHLO|nr:hypothetical protein CYMTET_38792 [Cymbomonas tetramitiformis]